MSLTQSELAEVVAAVKAEVYAPSPTPLAVGGFFQVAAGQTILADHMNTALVNGVPKFASIAARDAQWPTPVPGAMCYILDLNYFQYYDILITGGSYGWRTMGMRMGYGQMGNYQAIPNNTLTRLKIATVAGAGNAPGRATWTVNADFVKVPLGGTYLVTGDITWPSNPTGERRTMIHKADTAGTSYGFIGVSGGSTEVNTAGSSTLRQSVAALVTAAANERIALVGLQNSGGTLNLPSTTTDTATLALHFMGSD